LQSSCIALIATVWNKSGTTDETIESDADLDAVRPMFDLLYAACAQSNSNLQILVLVHANLPDDRYQKALIEEPWSGKNIHAPIQQSWA